MDLELLRPLYDVTGPVVSVHLDTSREDQDADHRLAVVWRTLRRELEERGVAEATLAALDSGVGGTPHVVGPQGESLFACQGRLLAAFTLSRPPARNRAVVQPLADPLETVLDLDHQLPYVMVAVDREGADIDAYAAGAFDPATSRSFSGSTLHITRVRAGGPSQASYHRRSVNVWTENAAAAAAEIAEACEAVAADLVFVGGDPKAAAILHDQLTERRPGVEVVEVSGGRGGEDAIAVLRSAVDEAVATASSRSHAAAVAEYRSALAQNLAVHGIPAVSTALAEGRVATLLLAADRSDDPRQWAADANPLLVASAAEALQDAAAVEALAAPLLLRAATMGGARFSEIPAGTADDGVAAVLRFAAP
ncbi:Vms1/Ankzf1 family peptidyl-tRNA hydrolase [Kitasatospora herbaricolor]|uniref:Vms1/Ankzf1 family peptidyl-tRNA hydrolase n=1 Tax=Kitasatospora herbaricolor TaxID=68217 RepID=A0ABZ1WHF9_9ACTN|nr:Vms1/Ankzf1 family peptidyl-tRNA hydrolase [Kitasatospora herbaricolor]